MRKTGESQRESLGYSVLTMVMTVVMVLFISGFTIVAQAAGTGKITATSAKIRKEASTSSDMVGSAQNGETVTINSEVQGSDGYVWYQVTAGNISGYIRSDLIEKTEGTETTPTVNPTVEVTQVQPAGATVTNGQLIRVRTDASTSDSSSIITTLSSGAAITVVGQANGTDGNVWYQVSFTSNNTEIQGFIRSEYVALAGELVPIDTTVPSNPDTTIPDAPVQVPEEPEEQKLYDTELTADGVWVLIDNANGGDKWPAADLIKDYQLKVEELIATQKSVKTQKVVIIILVVILIAAILAATMLYFKVRDVMDEAYFTAVEKETLKERNAMKNKDNRAPVRKVMQTVGTDGTKMASEGRGAGNRTQGRQVSPQGNLTVNGQSGASQSGQTRPIQSGQARPAQPGQARPAQPGQTRATQSAQPGAQAKAAQPASQNRPAATAQPKQTKPVQNKGFANDDDEFEFEFLNWDGEEK